MLQLDEEQITLLEVTLQPFRHGRYLDEKSNCDSSSHRGCVQCPKELPSLLEMQAAALRTASDNRPRSLES